MAGAAQGEVQHWQMLQLRRPWPLRARLPQAEEGGRHGGHGGCRQGVDRSSSPVKSGVGGARIRRRALGLGVNVGNKPIAVT